MEYHPASSPTYLAPAPPAPHTRDDELRASMTRTPANPALQSPPPRLPPPRTTAVVAPQSSAASSPGSTATAMTEGSSSSSSGPGAQRRRQRLGGSSSRATTVSPGPAVAAEGSSSSSSSGSADSPEAWSHDAAGPGMPMAPQGVVPGPGMGTGMFAPLPPIVPFGVATEFAPPMMMPRVGAGAPRAAAVPVAANTSPTYLGSPRFSPQLTIGFEIAEPPKYPAWRQ